MGKRTRTPAESAIARLYHNRDTGLCYRSDGNTEPIFYYDSSFIQFADSKAQYCVVGQLADGPITYVSHKHEPILDSTPYAEYVAQFHANKKALVIRNLLSEFGGALAELVKRPTLLLGDNDPATKLAKEMKATSKSKHWLLKYHLCRQNMSQGITLPLRVPTKDNNSDCGTKCQSAPDFTKLRKRLTGYAKSYTPPEWEPLPLPTEELTELLKPVVPCPSNIFRCDTRPAKPLDLCLVDLYQNPDLSRCLCPAISRAALPAKNRWAEHCRLSWRRPNMRNRRGSKCK